MGDGILAKNRTQAVQEGQNVAGNISDWLIFFFFPSWLPQNLNTRKGFTVNWQEFQRLKHLVTSFVVS